MLSFRMQIWQNQIIRTMKAELICILERFPELKQLILSQYERSEEFQALCLDYFLCLRSLNNSEANLRKSKERFEEYEELKRILETKALQYINRDKIQQSI